MSEIKREYIDTNIAAHLLGVSVSTMKRWRQSGEGPNFYRFGRSVKYRASDLRSWAKDNQCRINRPIAAF